MSKSNRREFLAKTAPIVASPLLLPLLPQSALAADSTQPDWRFCDKCNCMFFNGAPTKGRCAGGGAHEGQGFNFKLPYGNLPETAKAQAQWRFCDKCFSMFYNGGKDKGHCPAGGGHNAQGFLFRLPHDINPDGSNQGSWRFCSKCSAMFYDGAPGKGHCAGGGAHTAQGFQFVLPHGPTSQNLEEEHFSQTITTPSGTALGGKVDLTLRSDGSFKAHFHMHDSGVPDYKFLVRAVFLASNGMAFALQHSGHVEGTESTKLTRGPHRNDEKDIEGTNRLIKDHWSSIKSGKLAVSKEYAATGLVGFVEDVAKHVIDLTSKAAHGAAGAVIGLGDEMVDAIKGLKLSGDFGIVAGVVVFASGGSLMMAVTTGAKVGLVTKALIKQRAITTAEAGFAAKVFGGALPPAKQIFLTNIEGFGGRAFTMPGASGNIYLNVGGDAMKTPTTYKDKFYPMQGQLFIHELTHAWQIHHKKFVPGWVCSGLVTQAGNTLGDSAYKYPASAASWNWSNDFNIEQQGAVVDQWFGGTRVKGQTQMDQNDPFFHFIKDNIRTGRT
jgi:hypothetical protein